jgi:HSP20 family molecular chaperone IbpA
MGTLRPFELDPFDLLWRDLFDHNSRFSAITQKVTHPVDIYETPNGIKFEVAAVGLDSKDIDIMID